MALTLLPIIQASIAHYGMGILLIFGNIGNILVILYFRQYRQTACSIYLISAAMTNIVYLTLNVPIFLLPYFQVELAVNSLIFCKLRFYLSHVFGQMPRYFIILACIDRYIITNINFHGTNYNRTNIAKRLLVYVTLFWCIIGSHQLVFTTINNRQCGQFGIYYIVYNIYILISFSITPLIFMTVFGYLAYRQVKQLHLRIRMSNGKENRFIVHRKDRELLIMILMEVFIYFVTTIIYVGISLELLITFLTAEKKSKDYMQIESLILIFSIFLIYLNHAAPFYIYMFVSKRFRRGLKTFWPRCCRHRLIAPRIEPIR